MKFILWLIAGLWLMSIPVTGQTYSLSGRITDEKGSSAARRIGDDRSIKRWCCYRR